VCPHPPLLVPEVASGAAAELDALRAACREAMGRVLAAGPERLVLAGVGGQVRGHDLGGSMRRFGVDLRVGRAGDDSLPPALTVGTWLLAQVRCALPVEYVGCADDADSGRCASAVAAAVGGAARTGLVVMADLSAKLSPTSPGYVDERAVPFDRGVVDALAAGDPAVLAALDAALAEDLWCYDVPVLAGLAESVRALGGAVAEPVVHYDDAPYGVGYVVASWLVD